MHPSRAKYSGTLSHFSMGIPWVPQAMVCFSRRVAILVMAATSPFPAASRMWMNSFDSSLKWRFRMEFAVSRRVAMFSRLTGWGAPTELGSLFSFPPIYSMVAVVASCPTRTSGTSCSVDKAPARAADCHSGSHRDQAHSDGRNAHTLIVFWADCFSNKVLQIVHLLIHGQ